MTRLGQRGFSLVEIAVALAVILILAAVALPNINGYLDQKRVETAATQLAAVRDGLFNPAAGAVTFRQRVGANAGRLSHLDSVIVANNAGGGWDNSCGANYTNGQRTNWLNNGPFTMYSADRTSGMSTPIGFAEDTLTTIGAAGTNPRYLRINFLNAQLTDAEALELLVDGTADPNTGWNTNIVRWTPQNGVGGVVTLYYFVTINGTC